MRVALLEVELFIPYAHSLKEKRMVVRRVVDRLKETPEHHRYLRGLRAWVGYRQIGIPIERVVAWGFVMGVLSEVWTAQGGTPGSRALDLAVLLEP